MRAENIKLASLKTAHDCMDAIDAIELDRNNYTCTAGQWISGVTDTQSFMKKSALRKIEAITRKLYSLPDDE